MRLLVYSLEDTGIGKGPWQGIKMPSETGLLEIAKCFCSLGFTEKPVQENIINHRVDRVLGFFSNRQTWDPPNPLTRRWICPLPLYFRGGDTLACGRGGGGLNSDQGQTLWYSRYVCALCYTVSQPASTSLNVCSYPQWLTKATEWFRRVFRMFWKAELCILNVGTTT